MENVAIKIVQKGEAEMTCNIKVVSSGAHVGSISAVSRVRSLILPRGMSAGSFSRTAAGNRA